ncbi:MAG: hypothetical protein Q9162_007111 [Coniocarpon cinnabarinum]
MWGSKKHDDSGTEDEHGGGSSSRPRSQDHQEPTERTRLINHNPQGYLDPDDPAVSPYNLWTVRFLRHITVLFTVITFIWWTLLLVSIFVSPPGMHSRGSGFTDFSYTCLTLGNLLVALLFFADPSRAMRIFLSVLSVFLLADVIIIVTVTRLRIEEGWVGVTSAIWTLLMSVWCVLTDRVVEWGKKEEEERLTGRPEKRKTLRQWLGILFASTILLVFVLIAVLMTATLVIRSIDAGLTPDGQRYYVDGDKYEVHLACVGNATSTGGKKIPTVMLEAGEDAPEYELEKWAYGAFERGVIPRYCYWDRPGYGWSDNAPSPHSAGMSADALSEALAVAGETGPWISVSAGYGSIVARIFSAERRKDVLGIMMIDPLHEDLLSRLSSPGKGFITWGYGIISPLGIRRIGGAIFGGRTKEDRVYGPAADTTGKFLKARLQENLIADSLSKNEAARARTIQNDDTPFVVVSSGIEVGRDSEWNRKQQDLYHYTNRLVSSDVVAGAPHRVWRSKEGAEVMEKRLDQLVKAVRKDS